MWWTNLECSSCDCVASGVSLHAKDLALRFPLRLSVCWFFRFDWEIWRLPSSPHIWLFRPCDFLRGEASSHCELMKCILSLSWLQSSVWGEMLLTTNSFIFLFVIITNTCKYRCCAMYHTIQNILSVSSSSAPFLTDRLFFGRISMHTASLFWLKIKKYFFHDSINDHAILISLIPIVIHHHQYSTFFFSLLADFPILHILLSDEKSANEWNEWNNCWQCLQLIDDLTAYLKWDACYTTWHCYILTMYVIGLTKLYKAYMIGIISIWGCPNQISLFFIIWGLHIVVMGWLTNFIVKSYSLMIKMSARQG